MVHWKGTCCMHANRRWDFLVKYKWNKVDMCVFVLYIHVCLYFLSHWPNYSRTETPRLTISLLKSLTPFTLRSQWWTVQTTPSPPTSPHSSVHCQIVHHNRPTPLQDLHCTFCSPHLQTSPSIITTASALSLLCSDLVVPLLHLPLWLFFLPSPLPFASNIYPPSLFFFPLFFNSILPLLPPSVPGELTTQGEQTHTTNINGLGWILINCAS